LRRLRCVWDLCWCDVLCLCLTLGYYYILLYYSVILLLYIILYYYIIIYYTLLFFSSIFHIPSPYSSSTIPLPFLISFILLFFPHSFLYHLIPLPSSSPSFILYLSILIYIYLYSRLINNFTPHVLSEACLEWCSFICVGVYLCLSWCGVVVRF